ncbi:MAG: D-aminoacylase [Rhodothermales bacterium]|nr:D-aminoacylase [Rhodothermales bacterium]
MTNRHLFPFAIACLIVVCISADARAQSFDTILRGGTMYDGTGNPGFVADVALRGDSIAAIGDLRFASATTEIDARGLAVAPGFINMLSWAGRSLIEDGRGMSDILQGVTLEVMGEGWSMGPWSDPMKADDVASQGDIKYDVEWTTLGEYLEHMERSGVSPNITSFVGATTLRIHEVGYDDRPATADELARMQDLVADAMEQGAVGVSSSLIYAPAFYASTEELIELARVAAVYGGIYISHIRNEGSMVLGALDELIDIARAADVAAEVYHLKASGRDNWHLIDDVFRKIEQARADGLRITADMYTYPASSTGLNAIMPPWVQEGGFGMWRRRLMDAEISAHVAEEMRTPTDEWENSLVSAGAGGILLTGFRQDSLRHLVGRTLADVAAERGMPAEETAIQLVVQDSSRVSAVFFTMTEGNVRKKIQQPWVSIASDAGALAAEGVFLNSQPHPRAYGTFARVLGRYVRDEGLISLPEAIRRMTSLPASNLSLRRRGLLRPGYFADLVLFDPATIRDTATFEEPHQYAIGVRYVFVNGETVVRDGQHTGATPGRVVRGPGWTGWKD